jgi:hypothetical protein
MISGRSLELKKDKDPETFFNMVDNLKKEEAEISNTNMKFISILEHPLKTSLKQMEAKKRIESQLNAINNMVNL